MMYISIRFVCISLKKRFFNHYLLNKQWELEGEEDQEGRGENVFLNLLVIIKLHYLIFYLCY